MSTVTFSVVVPVYNAMDYLPDTVPAMRAAAANVDAPIVFVDNGSTDGSYEFLAALGEEVRVLRQPGLTISALRNRGAGQTESDVIAFIDADCLAPVDYLQQVAAVLEATGAHATGSAYDLPERPHWIEATWQDLHGHTMDTETNYLPAGSFNVRREAFEAVDGFDEDLATGEDAELCQRLRAAGYRVYASSRVRVRHLGNPKTLLDFFRKQRWHALGMFGTFRRDPFDKPVWLTFLNLGVVAVAAGAVLWWGVDGITAAVLLLLLPPVAAVLFRWLQVGRAVRPLRSLLLYGLYVWARTTAMGRIAWRTLRGISPGRG